MTDTKTDIVKDGRIVGKAAVMTGFYFGQAAMNKASELPESPAGTSSGLV